MTSIKSALLSGIGIMLGACSGADSLKTTLFEGAVTYCYNAPLTKLAAQGKTTVFGIDKATKPSLAEINNVLEPFGRLFAPSSKGDPAWVLSGSPKWQRLCDVVLPENAKPYMASSFWIQEESTQRPTKLPLSYQSSDLDRYNIHSRAWFVDDRLVHVEVMANPK